MGHTVEQYIPPAIRFVGDNPAVAQEFISHRISVQNIVAFGVKELISEARADYAKIMVTVSATTPSYPS